jgi:SPP1 family predicted phage head-tail adaptor
MIDFELYDDVIVDFSKNETFTRFTTADDGKGRDVPTPIVPPQTIFCYIHPATDKELQAVNQQGEHIEAMVKIFAPVDADILPDDQVTYSGQDYRILKRNIKLVGNYSKFFAGLMV